jgi:hypothetical protein
MPKFLESKLKSQARKEGLKGKEVNHYAFGAMNNMGAMRGSKETEKGEAMDAKHAAKLKGEAHSYDFNRKTRSVVSRYSK